MTAALRLIVIVAVLWASAAYAQLTPAPASQAGAPEMPADALGRETPRGAVLGFLTAARAGDLATASQYLETTGSHDAAEELARQLFVVLDARLTANLLQVSAEPEGSRTKPYAPNEERIGSVTEDDASVDIVLTRVKRAKVGQVWLFSRDTLASVPAMYNDVTLIEVDRFAPRLLRRVEIGGIPLFEWMAVLVGLPLLYVLTGIVNRLVTPLLAGAWQRISGRALPVRELLPAPVRLIVLGVAIHWLAANARISIFARQFWFTGGYLLGIAGAIWFVIRVNRFIELLIRRRVGAHSVAAVVSLVQLGRGLTDILVVFIGGLVLLHHLGIDPTPALAGLGVGGIAVALAAQKTLENVIAGMSLVFDRAVGEGDTLKVGDVVGTVDHVGLRSTRIRTLDRTVVTVPNSQVASVSLETLSARDQFWFHPLLGLTYSTTPEQLRKVLSGIEELLRKHPLTEPQSVRVRFIQMAAYSLQVDVFAYVNARDWNHFLEVQEQLLFSIMALVRQAGTDLAFPSQTLYVASQPAST